MPPPPSVFLSCFQGYPKRCACITREGDCGAQTGGCSSSASSTCSSVLAAGQANGARRLRWSRVAAGSPRRSSTRAAVAPTCCALPLPRGSTIHRIPGRPRCSRTSSRCTLCRIRPTRQVISGAAAEARPALLRILESARERSSRFGSFRSAVCGREVLRSAAEIPSPPRLNALADCQRVAVRSRTQRSSSSVIGPGPEIGPDFTIACALSV